MLVALDENGTRIYAENAIKTDENGNKLNYYCPECGDELILRQGTKNIWHYAHKNTDVLCNRLDGWGESIIHQRMKAAVKKIIERDNHCLKSELEWKLGNRIADYYFEIKDRFGNRKKVGIVCALQHNPVLLILDEPTSGLDPLMQKEFFEILKEKNEKGTTILLSSHILSEIQRNCNKAAIIRDGKIIACDTVENLSNSNAKYIQIHGNASFDTLNGIKNMVKDKEGCSFLYNGDISLLLNCLSKGNIKDITISEPDLEEVFMHYYKEN